MAIKEFKIKSFLTPVQPKVAPVQQVVKLETQEEALTDKLLEFIYLYLSMVPKPTQTQIIGLSDAIGCKRSEFENLMQSILGENLDDEVRNSLRDSDLKGNPGLNIPGDLDSFDANEINPFGKTDLTKIESPYSLKIPDKLLSSSSKTTADFSEDFLTPLENLETADAAPTNKRTGVDDGALVNEQLDDDEQQELIDDGADERLGEMEQLNDTSLINDGSI